MEEKPTNGILKEHMIFQKTHTTSLADVRTLNMWGFELFDVSIVERLSNVETISLSLNKISTLKPFAGCYKLKSLYLRQNNVSDLDEIYYLSKLPNLRSLMLRDNPVSELPNYRSFVAKALPQLEKLDDIDISVSDKRGGSTGGKNQMIGQIGAGIGKMQNGSQFMQAGQGLASGRGRLNRVENIKETFHDSPEDFEEDQQKYSKEVVTGVRASSVDDHMLTAVLALIPELSDESIQIVLDAIRNRKN